MRNIFHKLREKASNFRPQFSSWVLPFALIIITVILCFKSFTPETFLTGWDTLHPEFNLSHAFKSVVFGVWRSDQGLGAIAAHSHMSELPRLIYLFIASKLIPLASLRYSYVFLCLILGPLGMFLFLKSHLKNKGLHAVGLAALVGASYYLLNLGTVQRFSVPFEMFTAQFAVLGWVFWFAISYLKIGKKKFISLFALASFIGSSQAYAATLFYAFAALFSLSVIIYILLNFKSEKILKRGLLLLATLFAVNSFWLLPNLYSIRNQSAEVSTSAINRLFTPEAVIHNQASGNFLNVISQKNYLFSWQAYDFKLGQFTDLLNTWNAHLSDPRVAAIPVIFAVLSLLGVIVSIYKKQKLGLAFLLPTLISLFFLMNTNGPLGSIYLYLQTHSGLFAEGFRDPFTKFSTIFSFFMAYYIGAFLAFIFDKFRSTKLLSIAPVIFTATLVFSLGILMKPAFKEGLVSPLMRVSIPQNYFDAFTWFNEHDDGRVAQLPLNSMWGWQYNSWGYQGAGFFWFGINNPYLTRDFDRWSSDNETFYKEISRAYYSNDISLFDSLIEKYNVQYLLLDGSIFDPGNTSKVTLNDAMVKFLSQSKHIKSAAKFGFITIFESDFNPKQVNIPAVYSKVNANATYSSFDYAFSQYGDYVSGLESSVWKPFINFDNRVIGANSTINENWMTITSEGNGIKNQSLTVPDMVKRESVLPVKVSISKTNVKVTVRFDLLQPVINIDGKEINNSPVYLTTNLQSRSDSGYLAVENTVFDISSISSNGTEIELGSMYVSTLGNTKLSLFSKKIIQNTHFLSDILAKKASWCSDPSKELGLTKLKNGFSLTSDDQSVCVGALVSLPAAALYETSFISPTGSSSLFCENQVGKDGCVNVLPPTAKSVFGGREIHYQTPLESGNYWFAFVGQSVPNTKTTATYDQLSLSYHPQISQNFVDFGGSFGLFSAEKNIDVESAKTISVSFYAAPIISENFLLARGHANAVNCEVTQKGTARKNFNDNFVKYSATNNGVSCDYFDFPQLLQTQAYLMKFTGDNLSGRSLKFYLQNASTNHMDLEELLPSNSFSDSFVLNPFTKGDGGYVVNLETRSFDSVESINQLSELSFAPIPLNWLTEIAIGPKTNITENNNLKIEKVSQFGDFYTIKTTGSGIVTINESFEKGWVAIDVKIKALPHLSVNGWENGWNVTQENSTVYVFYLPQSLEFIGFGLLVFITYRLTKRA